MLFMLRSLEKKKTGQALVSKYQSAQDFQMVFEGAWDVQNCCDQSFQVGSNECGEVRGLDRVVRGQEGDAEENFPQ